MAMYPAPRRRGPMIPMMRGRTAVPLGTSPNDLWRNGGPTAGGGGTIADGTLMEGTAGVRQPPSPFGGTHAPPLGSRGGVMTQPPMWQPPELGPPQPMETGNGAPGLMGPGGGLMGGPMDVRSRNAFGGPLNGAMPPEHQQRLDTLMAQGLSYEQAMQRIMGGVR